MTADAGQSRNEVPFTLVGMPSSRGARQPAFTAGIPAQERELRPQGRRTMQRLLRAGREVFEQRGFHASRIDDIVRRAKTSHGTFYLYFANKEDLFKALAIDAMSHMQQLGAELGTITPDADGRASLREWMVRYVDVYAEHGTVIRAWTEGEFIDKDLGRRGATVLNELSGVLAERISAARGIDEGGAIDGVACLAMIERFNYLQQSGWVSFEREDAIDTLTRAVFEGFFLPDRFGDKANNRRWRSRAVNG
jgi:AcrR family transcriptional regulator